MEIKMLSFMWVRHGWIGSVTRTRTSEGKSILDVPEVKSERPD